MPTAVSSSRPVVLQESECEYLLSVHPSRRFEAKAINPHVWDPKRCRWIYPHTPEIYRAIKAQFNGELVDECRCAAEIMSEGAVAAIRNQDEWPHVQTLGATGQVPLPVDNRTKVLTAHKDLNAEVERLNKEWECDRQALAALRDENEALRRNADVAAAHLQSLNADLRQLRESVTHYRAAEKEAPRVAELQLLVDQKQQQLAALQAHNSNLALQLAGFPDREREIQHLRETIDSLKLKCQDVERKEQLLASLKSDCSNLTHKLTEQATRYKQLEVQSVSLQAMQKVERRLEAKEQEIAALQDDLDKARASAYNHRQDSAAILRQTAIAVSGQNAAFSKLIADCPVDTNLAITLHTALGTKLNTQVGRPAATLYQLIEEARIRELLDKEEVDLAHLIRQLRNRVAHPNLACDSKETARGLALICLFAGALLWPHLEAPHR